MKRILINATQPEELRVAMVDGQRLYDLDIELPSRERKKANIYTARITRVEPSLEAAFVDFGSERHGFLPFKEINRSALMGVETSERPIRELLREGQKVLVQVEKEERGNKGAALTTYVSLAGRYLVLMPNNPKAGGVSRRIEGEDRSELRSALADLNIPEGMGVIARTAGVGRTTEELQWDLDYMTAVWTAILEAATAAKGPSLIHQESNVIIRALRDHMRSDVGDVVIDDEKVYQQAVDFVQRVMPGSLRKLRRYDDPIPLFNRFQIESQIESAFERQVQLPSGGALVIDHTEALISIDVNSARATKGTDIEETALNTNLEAADEVARQLRIRDLGGLIVIDFIDMSSNKNQRDVENRLRKALEMDRARVQVGRISRFGLLEMSRQRIRSSLGESSYITCPRCSGHGQVRSVESLSLSILRLLEEEAMKDRTAAVMARVPVDVGTFLLNDKRDMLADIEERHDVDITIIPTPRMLTPDYEVRRVREDQREEATGGKASYLLTEETDKDSGSPEWSRRPRADQPAVQPIAISVPPPPAPREEVAAAPLIEPTIAPRSLSQPGFFARIWSSFFHNEPRAEQPSTVGSVGTAAAPAPGLPESGADDGRAREDRARGEKPRDQRSREDRKRRGRDRTRADAGNDEQPRDQARDQTRDQTRDQARDQTRDQARDQASDSSRKSDRITDGNGKGRNGERKPGSGTVADGESRDSRGARDGRETREPRQQRDQREQREPRESREPRQPREVREARPSAVPAGPSETGVGAGTGVAVPLGAESGLETEQSTGVAPDGETGAASETPATRSRRSRRGGRRRRGRGDAGRASEATSEATETGFEMESGSEEDAGAEQDVDFSQGEGPERVVAAEATEEEAAVADAATDEAKGKGQAVDVAKNEVTDEAKGKGQTVDVAKDEATDEAKSKGQAVDVAKDEATDEAKGTDEAADAAVAGAAGTYTAGAYTTVSDTAWAGKPKSVASSGSERIGRDVAPTQLPLLPESRDAGTTDEVRQRAAREALARMVAPILAEREGLTATVATESGAEGADAVAQVAMEGEAGGADAVAQVATEGEARGADAVAKVAAEGVVERAATENTEDTEGKAGGALGAVAPEASEATEGAEDALLEVGEEASEQVRKPRRPRRARGGAGRRKSQSKVESSVGSSGADAGDSVGGEHGPVSSATGVQAGVASDVQVGSGPVAQTSEPLVADATRESGLVVSGEERSEEKKPSRPRRSRSRRPRAGASKEGGDSVSGESS